MQGNNLYSLAKSLFPINRSITGEGVRETLFLLKEIVPELNVHKIKSGTEVFDWTIPKEWKVNNAWIETPEGKKICNFRENNLHLLSYSVPMDIKLDLNKLQNYLYSIPEKPDAIPYVTSYYNESWGFCLTDNERKNLKDGTYHVHIDSELSNGILNYGEIKIEGRSKKEVFLSTYICHPSMANNEVSGPCVTIYLAKWIKENLDPYYSYRIIFIPETIGSIAYLSKNYKTLQKNVIAGFNVNCVGDSNCYSFLPSKYENTLSDKVALHVLKHVDKDFLRYTWRDRGSDERQYCAPLIDLPIASMMRSKFNEYPEYHTSLDNLNFISPEGLLGGFEINRLAIQAIERNQYYKTNILCEPQLSKRGMYSAIGNMHDYEKNLYLEILTWCDSQNDLLEIAEKIEMPIWKLYPYIDEMLKKGLISQS